MMKLADITDSKSVACNEHAGSTPAPGTNIVFESDEWRIDHTGCIQHKICATSYTIYCKIRTHRCWKNGKIEVPEMVWLLAQIQLSIYWDFWNKNSPMV